MTEKDLLQLDTLIYLNGLVNETTIGDIIYEMYDNEDGIYTSGNSKGGNLSQYVTVFSDDKKQTGSSKTSINHARVIGFGVEAYVVVGFGAKATSVLKKM